MMEEQNANQQDIPESKISPIEITLWNTIFIVGIILGLAIVFPKLGRYFGERLNRLGLIAQVIGLVSLLPDYFTTKLKRWNRKFEKLAVGLNRRWAIMYYYWTIWGESVLNTTDIGCIQVAQFIAKLILGGLAIIFLKRIYDSNIVNPLIALWLLRVIEFAFTLWLLLFLSIAVLRRFKISMPPWLTSIFLPLDQVLLQTIYLLIWIPLSLLNYIFAVAYKATRTKIEDLAKQVAAPYITVGTIAELVATFFPEV